MGNCGKVVESSLEKSWEIIKKKKKKVWEGRGKSSGKFVGKSVRTFMGKATIIVMDNVWEKSQKIVRLWELSGKSCRKSREKIK